MKKNRLREADPIVEENNINETPMQASTQEVADAQFNQSNSNVDTLVEDTIVEETPQDIEVPEGSEDSNSNFTGIGDMDGGVIDSSLEVSNGGVKVNPETVSMEIEVPTDQLASAVAQATGDVVPAETAPDVEQAKEEELVAQEQEETELPSPLETESSMSEETQQPMGEKKMSSSKKVDMKFKKKLDSIINKGVENMAKSLKESEEDLVSSEEISLDTKEDFDRDLPEGYEEEGVTDEGLEDDFQDISDEEVFDFMGRLQGFLNNEETTPSDVSDALRTSADFMDVVGGNAPSNTPLTDTIKDSKEFDFDSLLDGDYEDGEVRDNVKEKPVRRVSRDIADDYEESLVRKPCKFPKDRTSIKESKNRGTQRLQETTITYDLSEGTYKPWGGAVDTWETIERKGLLNELDALLEGIYPEGLPEGELNDILWFDSDWVFEQLGISDEDADEDGADDFIEDDYEESLVRKPCKFPKDRTSIKESHKHLKKLKEGPSAVYKLRIEDLEPLTDTVKIISSDSDSCTFTVDVLNDYYKVSARHPYWGGEDWVQISGTLTGVYYIHNEEFSEFIEDNDDEIIEKEKKNEVLIDTIKLELPRYVTVNTWYGGGWSFEAPDKDFTLEDEEMGISDLREPDSYYFEFLSFEGHSDDLGDSIELMRVDESQETRGKRALSETIRRPKLKEASKIIYPAGSSPSESSRNVFYKKSNYKDFNLVREQERVIEGRRNAVRKLHKSVRENNISSNRKFNEALRTPVKSTLDYKDANISSWKNNRFVDKYEESQKLDFNILLNEGYLG